MTIPTVSVVIPTRGGSALAASMEAVLADPCASEVLAVLDGGSPAAADALRTRLPADERVRVISGPGLGASSARDAGVSAAGGEVVLLLDDDVVAGNGLVRGHGAHHAQADKQVVFGRMRTDMGGTREEQAAAAAYDVRYRRTLAGWAASPDTILHTLWAGNFSIRRADFLAAGAAPALRGAYNADRELGLRLARGGLTGRFDESLVADHRYRKTVQRWAADARDSGRSQREVARLHGELLRSGGYATAPSRRRGRSAVVGVLAAAPAGSVARAVAGIAVRLPGLPISARARALDLLWAVEEQRGYREHGVEA